MPDLEDYPDFNSSDVEYEDPDVSTDEEADKWKQLGERSVHLMIRSHFKLQTQSKKILKELEHVTLSPRTQVKLNLW